MNENKLEILMQNKNLVNTSYDITAIQNRIFYYCLLSAQKEKNGCLCCTVQANDLKKFIPNKNQRTLSNLKKTLQILKGTSLLFEKEEKGDNIECGLKNLKYTSWKDYMIILLNILYMLL